MTNHNYSPVQPELIIGTFRNLSGATRKYVTSERVGMILQHKRNYLMGLTYAQKCKVTADRVVSVVQRRLQKNRIYLVKSVIRLVLQAEEQFYVNQFNLMEEENYDLAA